MCCSTPAEEALLVSSEILLASAEISDKRGDKQSGSFHCFLAHDWGTDEHGRSNHARVARVKKQLEKAGLRAWFDEDQLRGDINGQMADGIDRAQAVVVFITHRYMEKVSGKGPNGMNDNCKARIPLHLLLPTALPPAPFALPVLFPAPARAPLQFEFDYSLRRKGVEKMIPVVMEEKCLDTSNWQARRALAPPSPC